MKKIEYSTYVILLSHTGKGAIKDSARSHAAYLKSLDEKGQLILGGPFSDYKGGMVIVQAGSYEEAKKIAELEPCVKEGFESYEIRTWELAHEGSNYLMTE